MVTDIDNLFSDFFREPWSGSLLKPRWDFPYIPNTTRYPIKLETTDNGVTRVYFEVPGVSKEDIEAQYEEETGYLTVMSKPKEQSSDRKDSFCNAKKTFKYQMFVDDLDPDSFEATCDKGVLVITGKKRYKPLTKKYIEIK